MILPNGKLIQHNNNIYQSNLLRLLTETDYNTLNNNINSSINSSVVFGNYTGNSTAYNYNPRTISLGFTPKAIISLSTMGGRIIQVIIIIILMEVLPPQILQ